MIGIINKKTIIYKCIACNNVTVAERVELDAAHVVVAGIVACNGIVAGFVEVDAIPVVADIIACNVIVAGRA